MDAPPSAPDLCIGRESELSRLFRAYGDLGMGHSHIALLRGPRGIGKTSILREFRSRVRLDGGVVLEGRCEPGQPYGPFAAILDAALMFLSEVGAKSAADLTALACRSGCHRLWFHHDRQSDDETPLATAALLPGHMEGDQASERRHRFYEAVLDVIRDVAAVRPPVLMIHDLDRANYGTIDLLRHILDSSLDPETSLRTAGPHTWLLVGSVASESELIEPDPVIRFAEARGGTVIEVGDLDIDGVKAYLHAPHTLARVLDRTGGNTEVIDRLLAAEPLSAEEMLNRQVAGLVPEARPLLDGLAVLEEEADLELIAQVTGAPVGANSRKSFWASPLLERRVADGRILFRFRKAGDRTEVLSRLDEGRRRDLHGRAATAHWGRPMGKLRAARHAIAAGDGERAIEISLEAARNLAGRHAHREAAKLLEEALELGTTSADAIPRTYLTELYRIAGDYPAALKHAEAVASAHPESADAARHVGHLMMLSGQLDGAADRFEAAYQLAHSEGNERLRVEVEAFLAELGYQRNEYQEARDWAERAMEESERLRLNAWHVHSRNTLGKLALAQGDAAEAVRLFSANLIEANECGLAHHQAQALTNLGVTYLRQQKLREAEETFARAVDVAAAARDTRDQAIATENLAVLAHLRRDYGTALRRYHSAVTMLKGLGNRTMLARAANNLGELYLSLGNPTRARSLCDYATHVGGANMPPTITAEGLLLRGRIERVDGKNDVARVSFEAAYRQLDDLGSERRFDVQIELARLALADGHVANARHVLNQVPAQESPKRATEISILTCDVERAAGGNVRAAAEIAMGLAERVSDDELLLPALIRMAGSLIDHDELHNAAALLGRAYDVEARMSRNLPEEAHQTWVARAVRRDLTQVEQLLHAAGAAVGIELPTSRSDRYGSSPPSAYPRPAAEADGVFAKFPNIIGRSASVRRLLTLLEKVAPTEALVLIRGESGTGKELVAEALHEGSSRRHRSFIKVNCAALVETLLLSELFGHEKGAFTGANARKKGRFELADGGTIFLDEIGDISAKTQVALLRVLQERQFERVGGTESIRVNVRIIAATHRDLESMVSDGTFREDLYYRLRGVVIESPPLRDRSDDVRLLADHVLDKIARERGDHRHDLTAESVSLLSHHRWPGNVRELENVLRSATLFADNRCLEVHDFQAFRDSFQSPIESPAPREDPRAAPVDERHQPVEDTAYGMVRAGTVSLAELKKDIERECIVRALDETSGNITRAAELLGMKRPRLSQLVKQYDLLAEARKR